MTPDRPNSPVCWRIATLACVLLAAALGGFSTSGASGPPDTATTDALTRVLTLESIEIRGAQRTPQELILRHLTLESGDPITADALEADRQRLLATDYFSDVQFFTRPGSERGAVVLVVDVTERGPLSFETGFGYHDLYGWFLTLGGLRFDNLFGVESELRVGVRLGYRLGGVDVEWAQALALDGRLGLGARLHAYGTNQRFYAQAPMGSTYTGEDVWREFQQEISRAGAEVWVGYGDRQSVSFSFGVRAESIDPDSSFEDFESDQDFGAGAFPEAMQDDIGKSLQTGFFLRVVRDTRNTPVYPSAGTFARLTMEANNTFLGGDEIFTRAEGDVATHVHIRDGWVACARANAGLTSSGTPYYDRFYLGGIYSIRGFAEWSLSNPGGDDGFWLANAELRWPLAGANPQLPRVTGLVFVDTGQGWRRDGGTSDVSAGAGYGMRVRLPWMGTLGLDVGLPLTDARTGDSYRLHWAIGFSF